MGNSQGTTMFQWQWIDDRTWLEVFGLAFLSFCAMTALAAIVSKGFLLVGVPVTAALAYVTISKAQHAAVRGSEEARHKDY